MPITISDPASYTVPPSPGFTPDRLGVRHIVIDVDRATDAYRVTLTPCPANATAWGPRDAPQVGSPDLAAEMLAQPDTPDRAAALAAVARIKDDLVTVAAFLIPLRG